MINIILFIIGTGIAMGICFIVMVTVDTDKRG